MTISAAIERRLLQLAIAILAGLPVSASLAGIVLGPGFLGTDPSWPADLDSHVRFLSGVFLVVGMAWWSCIPAIETRGPRLRLLAVATICGGFARLLSVLFVGFPSAGHMLGLGMELVVVPILVGWHMRIERTYHTRTRKNPTE